MASKTIVNQLPLAAIIILATTVLILFSLFLAVNHKIKQRKAETVVFEANIVHTSSLLINNVHYPFVCLPGQSVEDMSLVFCEKFGRGFGYTPQTIDGCIAPLSEALYASHKYQDRSIVSVDLPYASFYVMENYDQAPVPESAQDDKFPNFNPSPQMIPYDAENIMSFHPFEAKRVHPDLTYAIAVSMVGGVAPLSFDEPGQSVSMNAPDDTSLSDTEPTTITTTPMLASDTTPDVESPVMIAGTDVVATTLVQQLSSQEAGLTHHDSEEFTAIATDNDKTPSFVPAPVYEELSSDTETSDHLVSPPSVEPVRYQSTCEDHTAMTTDEIFPTENTGNEVQEEVSEHVIEAVTVILEDDEKISDIAVKSPLITHTEDEEHLLSDQQDHPVEIDSSVVDTVEVADVLTDNDQVEVVVAEELESVADHAAHTQREPAGGQFDDRTVTETPDIDTFVTSAAGDNEQEQLLVVEPEVAELTGTSPSEVSEVAVLTAIDEDARHSGLLRDTVENIISVTTKVVEPLSDSLPSQDTLLESHPLPVDDIVVGTVMSSSPLLTSQVISAEQVKEEVKVEEDDWLTAVGPPNPKDVQTPPHDKEEEEKGGDSFFEGDSSVDIEGDDSSVETDQVGSSVETISSVETVVSVDENATAVQFSEKYSVPDVETVEVEEELKSVVRDRYDELVDQKLIESEPAEVEAETVPESEAGKSSTDLKEMETESVMPVFAEPLDIHSSSEVTETAENTSIQSTSSVDHSTPSTTFPEDEILFYESHLSSSEEVPIGVLSTTSLEDKVVELVEDDNAEDALTARILRAIELSQAMDNNRHREFMTETEYTVFDSASDQAIEVPGVSELEFKQRRLSSMEMLMGDNRAVNALNPVEVVLTESPQSDTGTVISESGVTEKLEPEVVAETVFETEAFVEKTQDPLQGEEGRVDSEVISSDGAHSSAGFSSPEPMTVNTSEVDRSFEDFDVTPVVETVTEVVAEVVTEVVVATESHSMKTDVVNEDETTEAEHSKPLANCSELEALEATASVVIETDTQDLSDTETSKVAAIEYTEKEASVHALPPVDTHEPSEALDSAVQSQLESEDALIVPTVVTLHLDGPHPLYRIPAAAHLDVLLVSLEINEVMTQFEFAKTGSEPKSTSMLLAQAFCAENSLLLFNIPRHHIQPDREVSGVEVKMVGEKTLRASRQLLRINCETPIADMIMEKMLEDAEKL